MMPSVADLLLPKIKHSIDDALPMVGSSAICGAIEALLQPALTQVVPGQGGEYVRRVLSALNTPLPRVFVAAWRTYEEFLGFAPADGSPAKSGEVDLVDEEIKAHWELASHIAGDAVPVPSLVVSLTLDMRAGTVEVREGRLVALRTGSARYLGELRVKEAPQHLARVGPHPLPIGRRLSFGEGWAIRPGR